MKELKIINMKYTWSMLLFMAMVFVGCYFDNEEDLYPFGNCNTSDVTYIGDVLPVMQSKCYQCHDSSTNFGQVNLDSYESVRQFALNGRLFGAINHENGFSPMPKNAAKLADCDVQKIAVWIDQGALNN